MLTYYFEVNNIHSSEEEQEDRRFRNKMAMVDAVVKDKPTGKIIYQGEIPVKFNEEGVFPSVKVINSIDVSKEIKTELLFRSKRYIKKLRKWL